MRRLARLRKWRHWLALLGDFHFGKSSAMVPLAAFRALIVGLRNPCTFKFPLVPTRFVCPYIPVQGRELVLVTRPCAPPSYSASPLTNSLALIEIRLTVSPGQPTAISRWYSLWSEQSSIRDIQYNQQPICHFSVSICSSLRICYISPFLKMIPWLSNFAVADTIL